MDNSTRQALEKSIIAREKKLTAQTVADVGTGASECPLCVKFLLGPNRCCDGCPVADAGYSGCRGTPYDTVYLVLNDLRGTKEGRESGVSEDFKSLIRYEIDFLKSLRPQGRPQ